MTSITDLRWKRITVGGIAPHAVSVGGLVLAIVGYTVIVAFGTGGEPDPESLHRFNTVVGTQLFPVVIILLTVVAGAWVVRRVDPNTATAHGIAVGVLAGLLGLAFGAFDATMAVRFVATIVAGALGAKLQPVLFGK